MIKSYTGGIAATNAYTFQAPEGRILVDAPQGVTDWLGKMGETINVLLLTHHHFDHVMDAAKLQREHGCTVYAFTDYDPALTLEDLFKTHDTSFALEPYKVDVLLEGETKLDVLGNTYQLLHIPGHSTDSLCYHDPTRPEVFGGDVLMQQSIGRSDFPGGNHDQLIKGIKEKLLPLPGNTAVHPGHGPSTTIADELRLNVHLR